MTKAKDHNCSGSDALRKRSNETTDARGGSNRVTSAREQFDDILLRASTSASASYSASIISIRDGTSSLALSKYSARHAGMTHLPYFLTAARNLARQFVPQVVRRNNAATPQPVARC